VKLKGHDPRLPVGLYSSRGDIEIEGTPGAIRLLVEHFRGAPGTIALAVPWQRGAAPYNGFLTAIRVEAGAGMVTFRRQSTLLAVSGAPRPLALLAESIATLVTDHRGAARHVHIEYYPGHAFIDPDSLPVVVGVV